jgi:hypothetical protein
VRATSIHAKRSHIERPLALALRTAVGLDLCLAGVLEEGAQHVATSAAVKLDLLQLREHVGAASHDTRGAHELVKLSLPAAHLHH